MDGRTRCRNSYRIVIKWITTEKEATFTDRILLLLVCRYIYSHDVAVNTTLATIITMCKIFAMSSHSMCMMVIKRHHVETGAIFFVRLKR